MILPGIVDVNITISKRRDTTLKNRSLGSIKELIRKM